MESSRLWINKLPKKELLYEFVSQGYFTPFVATLLLNKGFTDIKKAYTFLYPQKEDFSDPFELPGVREAIQRIFKAISQKEIIGIYGDSDVDGIVSAFILTDFLKKLGASVEVLIPGKEKDGYGFHPDSISQFKDKGVKLVITVDVGVSAHSTINLAKATGIDVIIMDHHEIHELPDAILVSGKLLNPSHPLYFLCGAGVVFTFLRGFYRFLKNQPDFTVNLPELITYLELTAIATLADMVPIVGENRIITYFGFRKLADPESMPLKVMFNALNLKYGISEEDLYFKVIPKLNAPGRLGHPEVVFEFLCSENEEKAEKLWQKIEEFNSARQDVELEIVSKLEEEAKKQSKENKILILSHAEIPKGLLGLIANRFKNMYNLPVLVLTLDNGIAFASGRAPKGINLLDLLSECKDIFLEFGGHPYALGFQIKKEDISELQKRLKLIEEKNNIKPSEKYLYIDAEVTLSELVHKENLYALHQLHPYGEAHKPPLLLIKNFEVKNYQILKEKHTKILISWAGQSLKAICFNKILDPEIRLIAGLPFVNTFNNTLEIKIEDVK